MLKVNQDKWVGGGGGPFFFCQGGGGGGGGGALLVLTKVGLEGLVGLLQKDHHFTAPSYKETNKRTCTCNVD